VALFRHAIIGALDIEALPRGERSARLAELAARTSQTPDGRARRFSIRTLWAWWSAYQRVGLAGLLPKVRKDHGQPKAVDRALLEAAIALRRDVPSRSTATLIHILQTAGRIVPGQLRRSTLDRHLAAAGMARRRLRTLGDKRYLRLLFERPNQFWVGDYHEAPLLWDPAHQRFRTLHLRAVEEIFGRALWEPPHPEIVDQQRDRRGVSQVRLTGALELGVGEPPSPPNAKMRATGSPGGPPAARVYCPTIGGPAGARTYRPRPGGTPDARAPGHTPGPPRSPCAAAPDTVRTGDPRPGPTASAAAPASAATPGS